MEIERDIERRIEIECANHKLQLKKHSSALLLMIRDLKKKRPETLNEIRETLVLLNRHFGEYSTYFSLKKQYVD